MLTVVTHTNPNWGRDISRTIDSVRAALPSGCRHEIIECCGNFQQARYDAMKLDDVVVFVDDDDYVSPESLDLILQHYSKNDVGLIFTNEVLVKADSTPIYSNSREIDYCMIAVHPQAVHHMSAISTKYVTERSINLANKYKMGIEWILKCEAAYAGGALHLNHDAYFWVQHKDQHHLTKEWQNDYKTNFRSLSKELKTWCTRRGKIPIINN